MSKPKTDCMIKPTLFCGGNADEVAKHYISIFPSSTVNKVATYPSWGGEHHGYKKGSTLIVYFSLLDGAIKMAAVNGPPNMFKFTEAISFTIHPDGQEETDYYWDKLTEGADQEKQFCCWCQDKFGVWWQVIPKQFWEAMNEDQSDEKRSKVMEISFKWKKAILAELEIEMKKIDETNAAA